MKKQTFALFFGNRGFFPGSLIASARQSLTQAVKGLGFSVLDMGEGTTRYGAVETVEEGRAYAKFLKQHEGNYDGVILSLPNFGDENGAIAALAGCGVPILVQAWPDDIGKLDFANRRDAFCGKLSIMDVFYQNKLPFTAFTPHVVSPGKDEFKKNLLDFAAVCRVVRGMSRLTAGAIGARTTAFKTVRFDEIALQGLGITVESLDLSDLFLRIDSIDGASAVVKERVQVLAGYTDCSAVPQEKHTMLARIAVVLDAVIAEYGLNCLALRCWDELERRYGVAPCVILSMLNERGISAACELDVCNALTMHALHLASDEPAACLDWNNNYSNDPDKCILFHCGPVPSSLMASGTGHVTEQLMFKKSYGNGCGWGCNEGRLGAWPMTYSSAKTENGRLSLYLGQGELTSDPIEEAYFGCCGVAQIPMLQQKLLGMGKKGFRHHVSLTKGLCESTLREAFTTYLGYDIVEL